MKKMTFKTKYIWLAALCLTFAACNEDDSNDGASSLPPLTSGQADFSNYVAIGNSITAGYTDGALFRASQINSFPNIMSSKFSLVGGGSFNQPLTNDNFGGLALGGNRIPGFNPRLVTTGGAPVPLESVIGPVTVTTDIVLNNPLGPFNNLGVPGAKSFHLLAPGYGNIANLSAGLANPYFIRMTGNTPDATIIELAMAQNPTFFSLWVGTNDILGYAYSGGDGSSQLTDPTLFDTVYNGIIATLTSGGAGGVVANVPYMENLSFFTTIKYDILDPNDPGFADYASQIPLLNATYAQLNQAFAFLGVPERAITFSETEKSPVVIHDEDLVNISASLAAVLQGAGMDPLTANLLANQFGQARQATADDIFLLTSASAIGQVNVDRYTQLVTLGVPAELAGQLSVNGLTYPLEDKYVLLVNERIEIFVATDAYNVTIQNAANAAGLAFVDAKSIIQEIAEVGYSSGGFVFTDDLVTGGAFSLDGLHPNSRGSSLIANEFLKAIDAKYNSNFEASGNLANLGDYPTNYSPTLQ